jgi:diguanylate cyclase (GGDEF)-like protein
MGVTDHPSGRRWPVTLMASLSVFTGVVIAGASYHHSRRLMEQSQERARAALARGLVVALSDQLVVRDYAGMESRLLQAMADESLVSALVTDPSGKVLVHLQRKQPQAEPVLLFEPRQIKPPRQGQATGGRTGDIATHWTPVEAGELLGWLQLRTWSTSTDAVLNLLARQYLLLGVLAAALLSTLLGSGYRQLRRQNQQRERKLLQDKAELEHKALTDPLTGIYNRRGVERELGRMLAHPEQRRAAQLAVCMIDLDDFKPVNDAYGHAVGDRLLRAVCRRLRGVLRDGDLLGRFGGDEFIAVFQGCGDPSLALQLARRVTTSLNSIFRLDDLQVRIGASVGIALDSDAPQGSLHDLLERADQAMYRAKEGGKGQVVLAPGPSEPGERSCPRSAMDEPPASCPASPCP